MNNIILFPYEPTYPTYNDVLLCIKSHTDFSDGKKSRIGDLSYGGVAYYCKREYYQPMQFVVVSDENPTDKDIVLCQGNNGVFELFVYETINSIDFSYIKKVVASSLEYKDVPKITNVEELVYSYNKGITINQVEVGENIIPTQVFCNENIEPVEIISYEQMFKERYLNKFVRVWKSENSYWFSEIKDTNHTQPVTVYISAIEYGADSYLFFDYNNGTYSILIEI